MKGKLWAGSLTISGEQVAGWPGREYTNRQ